MKQKIQYRFIEDPVMRGAFRIHFVMTADSKKFNRIFKLLVQRMSKENKEKMPSPDDIDLDSFEVRTEFFKIIHAVMLKALRQVSDEVYKDGIRILTARVAQAKFVRAQDKSWKIQIVYDGEMTR